MHPVLEIPALKRFADEHKLAPEQLQQLVDESELNPVLVGELLHLATVKYRTLDLWGQKAEYADELRTLLSDAAAEDP